MHVLVHHLFQVNKPGNGATSTQLTCHGVIVLFITEPLKMPEVRELSEALPEMSMDPITGVGVVASRNRAPTGYDVVSH